MTPPDVSDAAVEAAWVGWRSAPYDLDEQMRAAIAAAVPHLLIAADWQVRMHVIKTGDMVYDWRQTPKEQFDAVEGKPHQGGTLRCEYRTLYAIRTQDADQ